MQQRQADLKALNISLVVVAEQDLTARQALTALGSSADIPILMGTTSVYDDYLVAGVPANYLIDPKGRMVTQVAGWVETLPDRWFQIVKDVGTK